jgi:hypothetical protein
MRNRRILAEAERGAGERILVVVRRMGFSEGTGEDNPLVVDVAMLDLTVFDSPPVSLSED